MIPNAHPAADPAQTGLSCWGRTVIRWGRLAALVAALAYGVSWLAVLAGVLPDPLDPARLAMLVPAGAALGMLIHAGDHHWHPPAPSPEQRAELPDLSPAEVGYCTEPGCGHPVWRVHRDRCLGLVAGEPCACTRPDPEYQAPRTALGRAAEAIADRYLRDPDVWHDDRTATYQ